MRFTALIACAALAACAGDGLPGPTVAATAPAALPAADWQLVWSDEFDGNALDMANWSYEVDCWGGGNNERQCYTDSAQNTSVANGLLTITARRQDHTGPALPPYLAAMAEDPGATATRQFTSARLSSKGKGAWKYGRIVVRAKLPQGQGVWPAIWMLPEDNTYGGWAASGEIDILEAVNLGVECDNGCEPGGENTILGTLHFGGQPPNNTWDSTEISAPEVLDGFHDYGVIWEPGRIRWTFDGVVYAEKLSSTWWSAGSDDPEAPFNQPFHLLLNLAIGGGLPEGRALGGVSEEGFPKQYEIDWVRVWQCGDHGATPASCGN